MISAPILRKPRPFGMQANRRPKILEHAAARYGIAVGFVLAAIVAVYLLEDLTGKFLAFPFYAAVVASAWLGTGPGCLSFILLTLVVEEYRHTPVLQPAHRCSRNSLTSRVRRLRPDLPCLGLAAPTGSIRARGNCPAAHRRFAAQQRRAAGRNRRARGRGGRVAAQRDLAGPGSETEPHGELDVAIARRAPCSGRPSSSISSASIARRKSRPTAYSPSACILATVRVSPRQWSAPSGEDSDFSCEARIVIPGKRRPSTCKPLARLGTAPQEAVEFIGTTMDLTERKRTEQALRDAESELARTLRLATVAELAAAIAHEINQPLAAITANGSACLRSLAASAADARQRARGGRLHRCRRPPRRRRDRQDPGAVQ